MAESLESEDLDTAATGYTKAPKLTNHSKKLVKMLNWCQSDDVSTSKAVNELRKLFDSVDDDKERRKFVKHLVFMIQVRLNFVSLELKSS